jgi:MEDS: MEthanogen/methylotroph, DcmR Sensory domain
VAAGTEDYHLGPGGHAVLFYSGGDELAGQVSEFLLEAIRGGGATVVIATPAHRESIAAALADAGSDVAARQAAGLYVALDAFETMDRFMVADWPSAASFWRVISPIVARAAEAGMPVHVFGEMVALLWDFGQVNAAIEVEALWNELAAQFSCSLLCAYPADSVRGGQHQDALAEVCRVHASVAGDVPGRA